MKERVLFVGGAGYIGGLSSDKLIANGFDVTVYDNLLYESIYLKPIPFIYGDIRETNKLCKIAENFDIVVLAAALVGDSACAIDTRITQEINHTAIKNFCQHISPNKHLIFLSTCSVYGAQTDLLDENSITSPLSEYASSKLAAEKYVLERGGTVFRLGTVFGLGDTYSRLRMDLVVNVLTWKASTTGIITINGGDQWRPIISVKDIASYILESAWKKNGGIFILSKENVIIRTLGERIARTIGNIKINYTEIPFQDSRNYKVNNAKSLSAFRCKPLISVDEEVESMLKIFKQNRIKNLNDVLYHNGNYLQKLKNQNILN